jgi:hypothetical protein
LIKIIKQNGYDNIITIINIVVNLSLIINSNNKTPYPTSPLCLKLSKIPRNTKRQYRRRLETFFNDIGIEGQTLDEKGQAFLAQAASNKRWTEDIIVAFIDYHKQRVNNSSDNSIYKIRPGTLKNYLAPIKQFYDAHSDDLPALNWKRISKLLPPTRNASNDRIPTIEEIKKLVGYPERRIKPLIYTMVSSGI